MNKYKIKKQVEETILDLIDNSSLEMNADYEIEYTQEWLNNWLMEWILNGYTTKEVMFILECFETFEYEREVEVWEDVPYEVRSGHSDTFEINEGVEIVLINTKKVA